MKHQRDRGGACGQVVRVLAVLLAALVVLSLSAWTIAALYIDMPSRWQLASASLCTSVMLLGAVILRPWWLKALNCLLCFCVVLFWWLHLAPSGERAWQGNVARTAWAEQNGNLVTIHEFRNFDYRTETDYTPKWEIRTLDLNNLKGIDLFLTYWGSPWIAHPILSFDFGNGQHVAISVETRMEIGETYSSLDGFFRQYELIYVIADERDVIRLRTNYRVGEEVYLYHSTATPEEARSIFLDYLQSANGLHETPKFYNALTSNCSTNVRLHTAAASDAPLPSWDWRLLLNGKSDEFSYEHGRLAGGLPFEELKRRAHINPEARAANDAADFSARIRENRPGFTQ